MHAYLTAARLCVKDWRRFLLACVFNIFPIVNFLVFGYMLEVMRISRKGEPSSLPPWGSWARLFLDGLRVFAVCIIWLIPLGLLLAATFVLTDALWFLMIGASGGLVLVLYILPSIFVLESQAVWKSLSFETLSFAFRWIYFKAWIFLMIVSVFFGAISSPAPLLGAVFSAYVLVGLGIAFGSLK